MTFIKTTNPDDAAGFVYERVVAHLERGEHVLLFLTGGSSIVVGRKIGELLKNYEKKDLIKNLTVTLTDERFGPVGHKDSNWQQLLDAGFSLPQAELLPILTGADLKNTTKQFRKNLVRAFGSVDYKIALFGMGGDGHVAGILPESPAAVSEALASSYKGQKFIRTTITPGAIVKLDEAVIWAQGEEKWPTLKNLISEIDIMKQPVQVLKKVPGFTIFSDYTQK